MTNQEAIEELQLTIDLIKQNGKDWLDERDIPILNMAIEAMKNSISKQAAIDAVEHITSSMSVCVNTDECHRMKRMQRQAVIELANLPSAQY